MSGPYVLVISLATLDATCTLFFTHLAGRLPLRIVQYPADDIARPLSGASAVIIVRGLFEFGNLIACVKAMGVPLYYFLDDNFMVIREEADTYGSLYARYTNDAIRDALARFDGVLLATESLVKYFADHGLHQRLRRYPPAAGPEVEAAGPRSGGPLTVAFFGGMHRRQPFIDFVYPAVERLAGEREIRLIASGLEPGSLPEARQVTVVYPAYDRSYTASLRQLAQHGVDILVHPSNQTANNIYKNPHVLINALLLGAAPIFSNAPPYDAVGHEGVAVLCENGVDSWHDALVRLAADADRRAALLRRLRAYCAAHFRGGANEAIIRDILAAHPPPDRATRAMRLVAGAACLAAGHLRRRVHGRLTRSRAR